jgi:DNA-binding XRE family transcriptional regulator
LGLTKRSCGVEIHTVPTDPLPDWVLVQRQQVGRRIRELRRERGLSQLRLAEQAGVERKAIYRAELATHSTGVDHLVMIAAALGVPASTLFS